MRHVSFRNRPEALLDENLFLALKHDAHCSDQAFQQGSSLPVFELYLSALLEVLLEVQSKARGDASIDQCEVHFVVELERPAIEIG